MKGPERLDRLGYPPIVLEPADVAREGTADVWTYRAKDTATGADVAVHLSREACSDPVSSASAASPPPIEKFTFRVVVEHAQIGEMKGCARSSPDLFPEFRTKNQDKDDEEKNPDEMKKKTVLDPITNFKPPAAVAFLNTAQQAVFKRGQITRVVSARPSSGLSVSHDGKRLLYIRENNAADRTLMLYDWSTGKSVELLHGDVQRVFWSPDDTRVAFMKFVDARWQLWAASVDSPQYAAPVYQAKIISIHGWADTHTIVVDDLEQLTWVSDTGTVQQTLPEKDLYGDLFRSVGAGTIRIHPLNPDLLLVTAEWLKLPAGFTLDLHAGNGFGFFLYEIRAKRRVILSPLNMFSQDAEWSRDGLQIFFTGSDSPHRYSTYRMFWDGSDLRKYADGSNLVIGQ
jgi:WD40 repeat protein